MSTDYIFCRKRWESKVSAGHLFSRTGRASRVERSFVATATKRALDRVPPSPQERATRSVACGIRKILLGSRSVEREAKSGLRNFALRRQRKMFLAESTLSVLRKIARRGDFSFDRENLTAPSQVSVREQVRMWTRCRDP